MDYINTSHPSFIGGSKAVEMALQQQRGAKVLPSNTKSKDASEWKDSGADRLPLPEKTSKSRAILARTNAAGVVAHEHSIKPPAPLEKSGSSSGTSAGNSSWGITSIFGGNESRINGNGKEHVLSRGYNEPAQGLEPSFSSIQLREPPTVLRATDAQTEQETVEIAVTRLLLKSYYDIVRKNIQDSVPKAIMHFLVNHVKRELHSVFIRKLYRESLFEEMLQEKEEIAAKRKRCKEILRVLQQAAWTLEELPVDPDTPSRPSHTIHDSTGLPPPAWKTPASSSATYAVANGDFSGMGSQSPNNSGFFGSPRNSKGRRPFHSDQSSGNGQQSANGNGLVGASGGVGYSSIKVDR